MYMKYKWDFKADVKDVKVSIASCRKKGFNFDITCNLNITETQLE